MIRLLALLLLLPALAAAQTRSSPEAASGIESKPLVTAETRMIVAADPLAAEAGLQMMERGGSAADAAIAALLVLNVVEPQSSGIGGGAFALVHVPGQGPVSLDARETAPMLADPAIFLDGGKEGGEPLPFLEAVASGHSTGVPGLVRLLETLHQRHGRLGWADLFEPAERLARDGFEVSPRLAASIAEYADRLAAVPAGEVFLPRGAALAEGALFRQPALAETLATLAAQGAGAFYEGPIAEAIVAATGAKPRPGRLALGDLAAYEVKEREPVCMEYRRAWDVCGMGPPSSGATTVGQILGILEHFRLDGMRVGDPRFEHLFAEASRLAYADRAAYLADSDFVSVPVAGLLDRGYLDLRSRLIDKGRASDGEAEAGEPPWREGRYAPDPGLGSPGTTHLVVIDGDGLAISVTASIETAFGSGRMAEGFLLNNQLTDFSFLPKDEQGERIANAVEPGKRPRSSMAPTIVYPAGGGEPAALAGSPGGSRIPEYVAHALVAMLDFGMDPAAAAAAAHVSQRNGAEVMLEAGVSDPALAAALADMGHVVGEAEMVSGLHLIRRLPDGTLQGGADPRREGVALGD